MLCMLLKKYQASNMDLLGRGPIMEKDNRNFKKWLGSCYSYPERKD